MGEINKKKTKMYYVASIDLLGIKKLIEKDTNDTHLNNIYNIYKSWKGIHQEFSDAYEKLAIKIFSDNFVLAIPIEVKKSAEILLEFTAYMCENFLKKKYKPRGGICKGELYIDEVFVWGKGLVEAYIMESKQAIYPRIILAKEGVENIGEHMRDQMIETDRDGKFYLNYLQSFGDNNEGRLDKIYRVNEWLEQEIEEEKKKKEEKEEKEKYKSASVLEKLEWLQDNMRFNENKILNKKQ